jgi:uncharacterized protein
MPVKLPFHVEALHVAETLVLAAAGGSLLAWLGVPAGLVSGSVLTVSIAALARRPVKVPLWLARVCFVLIGTLLGSVVTPETLRGFATWPASVAILAVAAVCIMTITAFYLRVVHRWDALSALLGASPGAMAQVIAIATELGGDLRGIAIVQTMRVLVITIGLPTGLALFGLAAGGVVAVPGPPGGTSLTELALTLAVAAAGAGAMTWIKFPGGILFGAMAGSAVLHGTGWVHAVLPWWLGSGAVLTMGGVVGSRFANTTPWMLLDYVGAALGSSLVAIAVATVFVLIVTSFLPFEPADVVIAFAPGAQDTMMVLALALHLDPVYVGAHQLARWLVVTFTVALAARRLGRRKLEGAE